MTLALAGTMLVFCWEWNYAQGFAVHLFRFVGLCACFIGAGALTIGPVIDRLD